MQYQIIILTWIFYLNKSFYFYNHREINRLSDSLRLHDCKYEIKAQLTSYLLTPNLITFNKSSESKKVNYIITVCTNSFIKLLNLYNLYVNASSSSNVFGHIARSCPAHDPPTLPPLNLHGTSQILTRLLRNRVHIGPLAVLGLHVATVVVVAAVMGSCISGTSSSTWSEVETLNFTLIGTLGPNSKAVLDGLDIAVVGEIVWLFWVVCVVDFVKF